MALTESIRLFWFAAAQMEIMQDRRLQFDDNRGLGQGVLDNRPTLNVFRLLLENVAACQRPHTSQTGGWLTTVAHGELQQLLHPPEKLIWYETLWTGVQPSFGDDREPLEADIVVAAVRNLPHLAGQVAAPLKKRVPKAAKTTAVGIVVHRTQLRSCSSDVHRSGTVRNNEDV